MFDLRITKRINVDLLCRPDTFLLIRTFKTSRCVACFLGFLGWLEVVERSERGDSGWCFAGKIERKDIDVTAKLIRYTTRRKGTYWQHFVMRAKLVSDSLCQLPLTNEWAKCWLPTNQHLKTRALLHTHLLALYARMHSAICGTPH